MAYIIEAGNADDALLQGLTLLSGHDASDEDTRGGLVRSMPAPVITVNHNPMWRVLRNPVRDANPFFHLFESLWMLAGRNDLGWLAQFNKRMASFSDDGGVTQPGAYGHRWRNHFGYDQIESAIMELSANPASRRVVITMWDALHDPAVAMTGGADVPCNTHIYLRVQDGRTLDMSVACRSNDAVWGAHGANLVHFSVLLEYMAARLGLAVGTMTQFSFNYHYYPNNLKHNAAEIIAGVPALRVHRAPMRMFAGPDDAKLFMEDLSEDFFERTAKFGPSGCSYDLNPNTDLKHPFMVGVVHPMLQAWAAKRHTPNVAVEWIEDLTCPHWQAACLEWLARRGARQANKGVK